MKKIIKTYLGIALGLFLAVSCNTDNKGAIYTPDGTDAAVSFLSTVSSDTEIEPTAATYDILVTRGKNKEAATVKIKGEMPEGITVPESISFAAGENETTLSLDISKMAVGETYEGKVSFADESEFDSNRSISSVTVTLAKAFTWESIGQGEFYDGLALQPSDDDLGIVKVEVLKAVGFNRWRIMNPFPKANVIAAWDEASYVGEPSEYIEFYLLDEAAKTIKFDKKIYCGLNYQNMGKIVYAFPSAASASYADRDAKNCFIDDGHVQFYVPQMIEGTTSWFNFGSKFLGMPGSGDLATWLNEE